MKKKLIPALMVLTFLAAACATSGYNKGQFNLYNPESEARLGNDLSAQMLSEYRKKGQVYDDPAANAYINTLGQRIAQSLPEKLYPYHFYILKSKEVNAFAIPGGHIFIFTGLINYCENEAELAGVMAHEAGHIVARHGTEQLSAQMAAAAAGAVLVAGLSGQVDPEITQLAVDIVSTGVFLAYSRKDEREADDIGARTVFKAGFNPSGMVNFFDRLSKKQGRMSDIEVFLSTHPDPGDREQHVKNIVMELGPTESLAWNSDQFNQIKAQVSKIVYPPDKKTIKK